MKSLRQLLPSAGTLIVFEAAGRHLSFTAAARELGMSQAAVSYAIGRLETQLSTPLFHREHRRIHLTDSGARFFADVSLGLSYIRKSAEDLRSVSAGAHVTLSASTAFASFWMVPRLQQFREDLPGIELRIQTSERDLDPVAEGFPLAIRGGRPEDWPAYEAQPLATEEVYAVCSTSYRDRYGIPRTVEDLLSHTLIHLEEPYRPAISWSEWLESAGVDGRKAPKGLQINDYVLVVQSVLAGQGIALGWKHLTDRLVESGLLVKVSDHSLNTGAAFCVIWPKGRDLPEAARRVRDWLGAQSDSDDKKAVGFSA